MIPKGRHKTAIRWVLQRFYRHFLMGNKYKKSAAQNMLPIFIFYFAHICLFVIRIDLEILMRSKA